MGYPCSINGCRTNRPGGQKRRTFSIPRDSERRKIWERAIGVNLNDGKRRCVCEKHFAPEHILRYNEYTDSFGNVITRIPLRIARLSKDAIPFHFPPETVDDKENYRLLEHEDGPIDLEDEVIIERNIDDGNGSNQETSNNEKQNDNINTYSDGVSTYEQDYIKMAKNGTNIECEVVTDFQHNPNNIIQSVNKRKIPNVTVIEQTQGNGFIIKIPYDEETIRNETCDSGLEMHSNDDKIYQEYNSNGNNAVFYQENAHIENDYKTHQDVISVKNIDVTYQEEIPTENSHETHQPIISIVHHEGIPIESNETHLENIPVENNVEVCQEDIFIENPPIEDSYNENEQIVANEIVECTYDSGTDIKDEEIDLHHQENSCTYKSEPLQCDAICEDESNEDEQIIIDSCNYTPPIDVSNYSTDIDDRGLWSNTVTLKQESTASTSKKRKFSNFETIFLKVEDCEFEEFCESIRSYKMPIDWLVHTPPDRTCVIIFEVYANDTTEYETEDFGSYDVRRSILIKDTMKVFYSALGRSINAKDFDLPNKFHTFEEFQVTLEKFSAFNVCCGIRDNHNINRINNSTTYTDCLGTLRHKSCSILTLHKKCISCEKIINRTKQKSDDTSKSNKNRNGTRTLYSIYYDRDIMNILKKAT